MEQIINRQAACYPGNARNYYNYVVEVGVLQYKIKKY